MSAVVRCASAASTSSCIPLTISATRSASARAACSPRSASRSFRRRIRSVRSRTNAESITSSPTRTRWMVSSAGNVVPSLRRSSTSTCNTLSGSGASIRCLIRSSWSSRPSSGKIIPRSRLPIASAADQPKSRSAAVFQAVTSPVRAVDRHERVRRGVEQQPDAGLALAQLTRARLRALPPRA